METRPFNLQLERSGSFFMLSKTSLRLEMYIAVQMVNKRDVLPLSLKTQTCFTVTTCCRKGLFFLIMFEEIQYLVQFLIDIAKSIKFFCDSAW